MEKAQIKAIFQENQWFKYLPQDVIYELIDMSTVRQLTDGQILYVRNDPAEGLYGVLDGALRISTCSPEGKQIVYTILEKGSWIGEVSLFDGQPRLNDAEALGDTTLLLVSRERFNAMLDQRPELYKHFMLLVCSHFRDAMALIEDRNLRSYQERLARQLVILANQHGHQVSAGTEINLRLPQEELALLVGTTRQRINKVLKDWEREQWVSVSYSRITINDIAALEALIPSL